MVIKSRMSSIMGLIEPEHLELFALELKNCYISLCLHSTTLNQSALNLTKIYIYNHKILDEFDYGSNRIRRIGVICP